jgi:hypothetical protein
MVRSSGCGGTPKRCTASIADSPVDSADLNLLTIHGKSRYPGLFIWLRDGRRVPVVVPDGCLLLQASAAHNARANAASAFASMLRHRARVRPWFSHAGACAQAGKQLEWLTGGHVKAGMHEVLFTPQTAVAVEEARRAGRSTWRASSTLFAHIASDQVLRPLGHFADGKQALAYPPTVAGAYVESELSVINLRGTADEGVRLAL